ncbi:hypothetical protein [Ruminococcus sp.]|uniref:hypothetical protein n=1 Tax=Ruminococcus sp. TaxID=41978 RepID=UPI0025CEBF68|nr:hypothetical protein [Ruminococcus sp.]
MIKRCYVLRSQEYQKTSLICNLSAILRIALQKLYSCVNDVSDRSVFIIHLRLNISTARVRAECKRILPRINASDV